MMHRSTLIAMALVATAAVVCRAQDVPRAPTHDAPKPATHAAAQPSHAAHATSGHDAPHAAGGHDAPHGAGGHDGARAGHDAPRSAGHDAPRSGGHDAPRPAGDAAPGATTPPGDADIGQMLRGVPLSLHQRAQIDSIRTRHEADVSSDARARLGAEEREVRDVLMPDQQAVFDRNVAAARAAAPPRP